MKNLIMLSVILFVAMLSDAYAQVRNKPSLEKGMNFIETRIYSAEDDAKILERYMNLRVADVSDGMDMVGLPGTGLVDPAIHSDWVDLKDFTHIFRGSCCSARSSRTGR